MGYKRRETTEVQGNVTFSRSGKKGPRVYIDAKGHNRAMHSATCIGSAEKIDCKIILVFKPGLNGSRAQVPSWICFSWDHMDKKTQSLSFLVPQEHIVYWYEFKGLSVCYVVYWFEFKDTLPCSFIIC